MATEIQVQQTPNPNARKFVLPRKLFAGPLSFPSAAQASAHPLAADLFALGAIYNVFMVQDFVTVNKFPDADWAQLEAPIQRCIAGYVAQQNGQLA